MDGTQDQRLRVWAALARPYLDTEPLDVEWAEASADLRASGTSLARLQHLQATLVAPALRGQAWYGRWIGLAPTLDDAATAAIEASWSELGEHGRLGLVRRLWWRWWTKEFWQRVQRDAPLPR